MISKILNFLLEFLPEFTESKTTVSPAENLLKLDFTDTSFVVSLKDVTVPSENIGTKTPFLKSVGMPSIGKAFLIEISKGVSLVST